jgi:hypothetical protein
VSQPFAILNTSPQGFDNKEVSTLENHQKPQVSRIAEGRHSYPVRPDSTGKYPPCDTRHLGVFFFFLYIIIIYIKELYNIPKYRKRLRHLATPYFLSFAFIFGVIKCQRK